MTSIARKCSAVRVSALLLALGGLGGCGSAAGGDGHTGSSTALPSSSTPSPTEVASVTIYGRTVTFYSSTMANGLPNIGMLEKGSSYDSRALVAPLLSEQLTSQEIYLALAPDGATAPPALVAVQGQEAARMGRSAEVQHATVPFELEQKTAAQCQTGVFDSVSPPGGSGYYWKSVFAENTGGNLDTNWIQDTTNYVIGGTCNPTGTGQANYDWWSWEEYPGLDPTNTYYIVTDQLVVPGDYYYFYWNNSGGATYFQEIGNATSGNTCYLVGGVQEPL